jgi:hypothetical protein
MPRIKRIHELSDRELLEVILHRVDVIARGVNQLDRNAQRTQQLTEAELFRAYRSSPEGIDSGSAPQPERDREDT